MEMEWHGDRGTRGAGGGDDDGDEYRGGTWRGGVALIGRGGKVGLMGKGIAHITYVKGNLARQEEGLGNSRLCDRCRGMESCADW